MVIKSLFQLNSVNILRFEMKHISRKFLKCSKWKFHNCAISRASMSTASDFEQKLNENPEDEAFDLIVIGGGIVGVTTARAMLIEKPHLKVAILEKENDIAMHQSSHNSGVIHAGIYYRPDSLRAKLCVEGLRHTYAFCDEHKIPYKKCGKLIVATTKFEEAGVMALYENALKNGIKDVEVIESNKIPEIEPYCTGLKALYSPSTGIIDWGLFTKYCAEDFKKRGGTLHCNFEVTKIAPAKNGLKSAEVSRAPVQFFDETRGKTIRSSYAILCGGLYSDKLAELVNSPPEPVIVPFRGEYLELKEEKRHLVKGNIYPVPDPRFPFLGVHFTPRLDGRILVGPNAVLAFSREGYRWNQINLTDLKEIFLFSGFRKLMLKYGKYGAEEMLKSFFISLRVRDLKRYIPTIRRRDLEFKGFTGVRAQALDSDGDLIDDMILQVGEEGVQSRIMHCRNAPSPSATSSLALSEYIAKSAIVEFDFDV